MFGRRWHLFRLAGIPIRADASWLIVFALVTVILAENFHKLIGQFYPGATSGLVKVDYWVMGLIACLLFFVSIVLHELGHALVARSRGIPIKGITLFVFGGVSELGDEPPTPASEFEMAVAGPAVSLVLGVILVVLARIGLHQSWPHPVVIVMAYLGEMNLFLGVFNLIPGFPLDGGRVFRSIVWWITGSLKRATRWAATSGQFFSWLFIAYGIFVLFQGNWGGLWTILIGMFLNSAAKQSYQQVITRQLLQGEPVRRFMNIEPIVVPPDLDLRHWVEDYVYRYHRKLFPVGTNGHLEGVIGTQVLASYPREEWPQHTVREAMRGDIRPISISPDSDALEAFSKMQQTGSSRLLVTEGDQLVGIVSLKDLLRFLHLKLQLETGREED
jgi:Zn-dependent protease